eukprot:486543_1
MSVIQIEGKEQLNASPNEEKVHHGHEGKSHRQANHQISDIKVDTVVLKSCAGLNCAFSTILIILIVYSLNLNILSIYTNNTASNPNEYFKCRWDRFDINTPTMDQISGTWIQEYDNCNFHSYSAQISCVQYQHSYESGLMWHYANILSLVSLIISVICCVSIYLRKYIKKYEPNINCVPLKKMIIITILFESFIPMILLLFANIYWFEKNSTHGCWSKDTRFKYRKMGSSMIINIICLILVGVYFVVCINYLRILYGKKKKRNKKLLPQIEENEMEGYQGLNDEQIEFDMKNDDFTVEEWFLEEVSIDNDGNNIDYKQMYCHKFVENGFDNFVAIKLITEQDLIDIGIDEVEHREIIMAGIQILQL